MAAQPREEDIQNLLDLTGGAIDRPEAIERLKGNNNDFTQAINEYFDDPSSKRYKWDESQFHSDRDVPSNSGGISFNIQGPDVPAPYFEPIGAPSRPPSRTNNKSPLSGVADLGASQNTGMRRCSLLSEKENAGMVTDVKLSVSHADNEDAQLQEALAASRADAGLPPQESGVLSTSQVHFGPATRSQYEQSEWAMVPISSYSAQEILLDPEATERKREAGAPAFLKPSTSGHRLGSLLAIYHEIPLAREIFLLSESIPADYGFDPEWWSGNGISAAMVLDEDDDERPESAEAEQFLHELQRLMAFLDSTDRSYGSVEALTSFPSMKRLTERARGPLDVESAFFEVWKDIWSEDSEEQTMLFTQGVSSDEDGAESKDFAILKLDLPEPSEKAETIYDLADTLLWTGIPADYDVAMTPYLSRVGNVIAFQFDGTPSSRNIPIPPVWYPDRYLKQGREAAAIMRQRQAQINEHYESILNLENKLTNFNNAPGGKTVKVQDLLKAALQHDEAQLDAGELSEDEEDSEDAEMLLQPVKFDISAELRKLTESIDKKLTALNEEKEKARETFRQVSKLYTEVSNDPDDPELHPYTLRGVATTKDTTYVRRMTMPEPSDQLVELEETKTPSDQWWKMTFSSAGQRPIVVEKIDEEKVLEAAMTECKNPILVYANETALKRPYVPLPSPLENFVRTDNLAFSNEFRNTNNGESETDATTSSPKSPGKRKYESSEDEALKQNGINTGSPLRRGNSREDPRSTTSLPHRSLTPPTTEDVIIGVDPFQNEENEANIKCQEMKEKSNLRMSMLAGRSEASKSINDSMDLDQVLEDADVREESAAVKKVGFVEQ
ncbi:hypothetical protein BP6252_01633 [Coleophoma cylindrospora]|uniref:Ubiquitin interaction motif protein n=1 Tax=Coleophoma cylindrospora TaxID=1849047 RepID=A0A3D8STU8_9HELO|nr:hypothetical protein BP6252_01633 [Coleophoma cylindrospora]